jgi:hypothetical protein
MRIITLALLLCVGSWAGLEACAIVTGAGKSATIESESALIIYDSASKTQHFIRRGNFKTESAYFGFLVPTPTQPTLGTAPEAIFATMDDWTKPDTIVQTRTRYVSVLDGTVTHQTAGKKTPAMTIIDQQRVGNYEATILRATDTTALKKWLGDNGFDNRAQVDTWLRHYIKANWYLTAFKMVKPGERDPGMASKSVRLSFTTDRPVYPYREPEDARSGDNHSPRQLTVYLVADQRMQGAKGDKTRWPGAAVWSRPLSEEQSSELTKVIAGEPSPKKPWLTIFEDSSTPRMGTADVYFTPSVEQTELSRLPNIEYKMVNVPHPGEMVVLGMGLCGGVVASLWFLRRKRASPPTSI